MIIGVNDININTINFDYSEEESNRTFSAVMKDDRWVCVISMDDWTGKCFLIDEEDDGFMSDVSTYDVFFNESDINYIISLMSKSYN